MRVLEKSSKWTPSWGCFVNYFWFVKNEIPLLIFTATSTKSPKSVVDEFIGQQIHLHENLANSICWWRPGDMFESVRQS